MTSYAEFSEIASCILRLGETEFNNAYRSIPVQQSSVWLHMEWSLLTAFISESRLLQKMTRNGMAATDFPMSRLLKLAHKFNCFYLSGIYEGIFSDVTNLVTQLSLYFSSD
jgi:hypothetical protein